MERSPVRLGRRAPGSSWTRTLLAIGLGVSTTLFGLTLFVVWLSGGLVLVFGGIFLVPVVLVVAVGVFLARRDRLPALGAPTALALVLVLQVLCVAVPLEAKRLAFLRSYARSVPVLEDAVRLDREMGLVAASDGAYVIVYYRAPRSEQEILETLGTRLRERGWSASTVVRPDSIPNFFTRSRPLIGRGFVTIDFRLWGRDSLKTGEGVAYSVHLAPGY